MNVEAGLVKIQKTTDEIDVVVKKAVYAGTARAIAAPKLTRLRIVEMRFEKLRRSLRAFEIARFIQSLAGSRQSGNHHAIPGCDNLIVDRRLRAVRARFEQGFASGSQLLRGLFHGQTELLRCFLRRVSFIQDILALQFSTDILSRGDVAAEFGSIGILEHRRILLAEHALDFRDRPNLEHALPGLWLSRSNETVSILGGGEAATRLLYLAKHKIENVARGVRIEAVVSDLVGLGVNDGKLCLVVEHLLEMWDEPTRTGGVAVETPAELVVDAAALHRTKRVERHVEGFALAGASVIPNQETQRHWPRKFRRSAKAAVRGVVGRGNLFVRLVQDAGF